MNPEKRVLNSLLLFLFFGFCISIDTITSDQTIKDGEILVSDGEIFALGFFSPGSSSSRYVGICYNKISVQTVVWVANRDNPINGTSGILSIDKDRDLVIYDLNQSLPLWRANVSAAVITTNSSYSARLLDSGNFVLFQDDNQSVVAWQSFDYPANTLLSNMKLGLDRRTGLDRFLTSWKSSNDPGTGEYSYRIDPSGLPQLVLLDGWIRIWRAGPWIGGKWSGIAENRPDFVVSSSYVDNSDELSVMYGSVDAPIVSIVLVDEFGVLKRLAWNEDSHRWVEYLAAPKDPCDYYGHCGVYGNCDPNNGKEFECTCLPGYEPRSAREWYLRDGSAGCMKKRMELGLCGKGEGFVKVARAKIPDTSVARSVMKVKYSSVQECDAECLRNCSCLAFTSTGGGGECIMWYGNLTDTRVFPVGGMDLYIRVDAVELAQQTKTTKTFQGKNVAVVVTSGIMGLLIFSLVCWFVITKRRRRRGEAGLNIQADDDENLELPLFDMVTIAGATGKFSDTNKIGEGGFGSVYKGQLPTGKEIAVKRLSRNSKQGLTEFKNEVILIAKLQHRNLVRLLGCCIHGEERMLIYEYMSNGSLDSFIFGRENTRSKLLTWRRRLDIIIGIAQGLLYLHRDSRLRVIHRDLKASNVLLDSEVNPKISDFGLARAFEGDQSSSITKRVVGTYGYMSPEYMIDGLYSMKSDIFSFGVILLEILSGKRNRLFHHIDHDLNLLGHAWKLWIEGKASELLDPLVEGTLPMSKLLRCIQVGLLCVQKRPKDRPIMSSVLLMLITETAMLPQPKQPGFYTERNSSEASYSQVESTSNINESINEMTMTQEAR